MRGTDVRVADQGHGPAILMIGPGLDDGSRGKKLAGLLASRFRVLRLHRRQYRMDLKAVAPCSVTEEVEDVVSVAAMIGEPLVVYGHSSGGVVALEAMAAAPDSFAGGVIFEPAAVIGPPLGGPNGEVVEQARAALAANKPGQALEIFMRDSVGLPAWQARLAGAFTGLSPHYRALAPGQIDDLEALDRLGVRLDVYAGIAAPTVLLNGDRSPAHLIERIEAIERAMPRAERVVLRGRDHGADVKAPREVVEVIENLADRVLPRP